MKLTKIVLGVVSLVSCSILALAQQESSLPILNLPTDTRLASMGNAAIGESSDMYLYANPTSLLGLDKKFNISIAHRRFEKNPDGHNLLFFDGSMGFRLDRHAFFFGGRHWRGPKTPRVNNEGIEGKPIPLNEATLDFGYAFKFNQHLSAYGSGSYVFSYFGKKTQTAVFNLGVYYRNKVECLGYNMNYLLGSRMTNFGPQFRYGKNGRRVNVPASWELGGEIKTTLSPDYTLALLAGTRYNFLPIKAKSIGAYIGGEVSYQDYIIGNIGYSKMKGYPDLFTAGLSTQLSLVRVGIVYQHTSVSALNNLSGAISVSF